jgi:hypothetical protein
MSPYTIPIVLSNNNRELPNVFFNEIILEMPI